MKSLRELPVSTAVALSLAVGKIGKIKAADGNEIIEKAELDD